MPRRYAEIGAEIRDKLENLRSMIRETLFNRKIVIVNDFANDEKLTDRQHGRVLQQTPNVSIHFHTIALKVK